MLHYKEFSTDKCWLPARKKSGRALVEQINESTGEQELETDPNGINLFAADLPDFESMREAPLDTVSEDAAALLRGEMDSSEDGDESNDGDSSKEEDDDQGTGRSGSHGRGISRGSARGGSARGRGRGRGRGRSGIDIGGSRGGVGGGGSSDTKEKKKTRFNKQDILEAVMQTIGTAKVATCAAEVFEDGDVAAWKQWHAETPETLEQVPANVRAKLQLPTHGYKALAPLVTAPRRQVELLVYDNSDGTKVTKAEKQIAFDEIKKLPVRKGDVVALKRTDRGQTSAGWDTPFYLGKVLDVITVGGSDTSQPEVDQLRIHWMAPFHADAMSNDVNKPWHLLCHGLHPWDHLCDKRQICKGGKWTELVSRDAVGAVDIGFTGTHELNASSKKALERAHSTLCLPGTTLSYETGVQGAKGKLMVVVVEETREERMKRLHKEIFSESESESSESE